MASLFDLKDQVVVVTGGTGVLAGAVARHLAQEGAIVALIGRSPDKLENAVSEIRNAGGKASSHVADVVSESDLKRAKDEILAAHGRVNALINGAGGNMPGATIPPDKSLFDLKVSDYDKVMDLNLKGTLLPSMIFGEVMASSGSGSIVNFSSMASLRSITRVLGYSNAKAAVDNLTRWLAMEFARKHGDKIRVNAVAPGFFIGEQNRALLLNEDGSLTERGKRIIDQTPMGRFGKTDEVSGSVHFLLSEAARFVTGVVLPIDGGFSIFSGV